MPTKNRGAVLIIVLGVLAILSLLAITFYRLTTLDRNVSHNYLDTVRARLAATSGIEDAVSRLARTLDGDPPGVPAADAAPWLYRGSDLSGAGGDPRLLQVGLEAAQNPSYALRLDPANPASAPQQIRIDDPAQRIGISGALGSGSYGVHGDVYSLRITDLQGLLHVNEGLEQGPSGSVSQNMRRVLNNLGQIVHVPGLGSRILAARPKAGYRWKRELLGAVGNDAALYDRFKDFVTVMAWQDDKVCNPVPLSEAMLPEYPVHYYRGSPPLYRYGRGKDARGERLTQPLVYSPPAPWDGFDHAVFAQDELNPQWIEIVRRAPVNVNSAPIEVLMALLEGLKGFFLVERRRNEPPAMANVYDWLISRSLAFRPSKPEYQTGEIGFLYSTVPIEGPATGTGARNSWSQWIAEEIIACRERRPSPHVAGLHYSTASFGGPFRNWRQWSLFCDRLADPDAGGFLEDTRPIYVDYDPIRGTPIPSRIQSRFAAQAIADVLKANFNPNLHLNESNPEAQLWLRVDKTDLVVNSTEFCFSPMGYFEIESIGRILQPRGNEDVYLADQNDVLATSRVVADVKLLEVYRETDQADFYRGTLSGRNSSPPTNNNRSLEIGPEPDNGVAASENRWSGYLALPTIGGNYGGGWRKTPGALESTPVGKSEYGSVMHSHFTFDGRLHHHANGNVGELASEKAPNEFIENVPDPTEDLPGPYCPGTGGNGRHRLARSFRLPDLGRGDPPALPAAAPLDLRLDGMYLERHCGLAYWLDATLMGTSMGQSQGVFSFWLKPGFLPEMSGKPRQLLTADRSHPGKDLPNAPLRSPFSLWYVASHDTECYSPCLSEGATPFYNLEFPYGIAPIRSSALTFGYGYSEQSGYGQGCVAEGGCVSPTLNHASHPDAGLRPNYLEAHRWTHVTASWDTKYPERCSIYINGKLLPGTTTSFYQPYQPMTTVPWYTHGDGTQNCVRLGATSATDRDGAFAYQRNWPADSTIDEFYWWNSYWQLGSAMELARLGRFYKPGPGGDEATFTSQEINLLPVLRSLPPPAAFSADGAGGPGITLAAPAGSLRLVGAQWTYYGEFADTDSTPPREMIHAYHHADRGKPLPVEAELFILQGSTVFGPWKNDGYSPLRKPDGAPLVIRGPFQYRIRFVIPGLGRESELRATPIFDDITLFYRTPLPVYVSYRIE